MSILKIHWAKLIFPACVLWVIILVAGSQGYEYRPGLKLDAPLIQPTDPILR